METVQAAALPDGIRELPIVAGDLALDFANTVDDPLGPLRHDHVADYRGLLVWARRTGVLTEGGELLRSAEANRRGAATVVRRAESLRTAINLTFGALVDGVPPDEGWRQLRPFVTDAIGQARIQDGRPGWEYTELAAPLWPVAHAAYELLTGDERRRIKRCAGCPWLFLDQSKNNSRRWCSMEICGLNEKMRRYTTRRAERRLR
ncbi:putative RNA-binding Zn ribbon-like protein [Kribbella amoyensis]|uniref:Putative RNA-binding Zn ribbon-like protein n=1 Tax=Kribbella amoyensis TaxID=996641 RepID=A0A561BSF9_9ACTN|nr:CGNR zinc finger domain-containing protein [Kribbella amoyensis]TWD81824.1 putative RNA-binding Zn ribbon-like protein [Kribbella amoyensis]